MKTCPLETSTEAPTSESRSTLDSENTKPDDLPTSDQALPSQWKNVNPFQFCFIKATLSSIEETLRYPMALIKTHQQVTIEARPTRKSFTRFQFLDQSLNPNGTLRPSAHQTIEYTKFLYRNFGLKGLYRGFPCYILPAVPVNVLYFFSYNEAKEILHTQLQSESRSSSDEYTARILIPAAAGVIADALCLTCWVPFDIISQHLQLQDVRQFPQKIPISSQSTPQRLSIIPQITTTTPYTLRPFDVIRYLWNIGKFRSFYRGYFTSLAIHTPSSGVWWVAYESTKNFLTNHSFCHHHSPLLKSQSQTFLAMNVSQSPTPPSESCSKPLQSPPLSATTLALPHNVSTIMVSGAVAGASASFVSNPLDVVKTRLQTTFLYSSGLSSTHPVSPLGHHPSSIGTIPSLIRSQKSRGFLHYFFILLKNEGLSGFFRGFVPRLCVSIPTSAVSLVIYETALKSSTLPSNAHQC